MMLINKNVLIDWSNTYNWMTWQDGKAFEEFVKSFPSTESEGEATRLREALEEIAFYEGSALTGEDAGDMKIIAKGALSPTSETAKECPECGCLLMCRCGQSGIKDGREE